MTTGKGLGSDELAALAQADNDIDVNDLQFVYGRFGSVCSASGQ